MAKTASFTKRSLISKANSTIVIATAAAAFVLIFTLVASKALVSQMSYQNRVISAKKKALSQLESDLNARDSLTASYKTFVGTPQNILGGNPQGTGELDGDNAKLILDALPSKYNFPALVTSVEKIATSQGMQISSISGTDDELAQQENASSAAPKTIPMVFQLQAGGSYQASKDLIGAFGRSIRPFQLQKLELSGNEGSMDVLIEAQTFFQPEKNLKITTEVVK